jgi:hypothetical protein
MVGSLGNGAPFHLTRSVTQQSQKAFPHSTSSEVCDATKVRTQKVRGRNPCPYLFVEVLMMMLGTSYPLSYEWVLGLSVKVMRLGGREELVLA